MRDIPAATSALAPEGDALIPALTGTEPLFFVMNSGSGHRKTNETEKIIARVMQAGNRQYELVTVEDGVQLPAASHQAVKMAKGQAGAVIAVGGDGTLSAVSQAVLGAGVPFGIVPQGTFNYFGRSYGISQDAEVALRSLLNARIETAPVGLLNNRVFLVNASLGLYPRLLEEREAYKQRFGRSRLVALGAALLTLSAAHRQLNIKIDSGGNQESLRTPTLVVDNNVLQIKQMGIDGAAELNSGRLIAITSKSLGRWQLYSLLIRGLLSRLGDDDHIITFGFETMTVRLGRGRRRIKVAMDGEVFHLRCPLVFRVAEHGLPLMVSNDPDCQEWE